MTVKLTEHDQLKYSAIHILDNDRISIPGDISDHWIVNAFRERAGLEPMTESDFTVPESLTMNLIRTVAEASNQPIRMGMSLPEVARSLGDILAKNRK